MSEITAAQVIDEVRKLAKESPGNIYKGLPSAFMSSGFACYYSTGENENGSVGCIFGQALKNLGLVITDNNDQVRITNLLVILGISHLNEFELDWCRTVQSRQDSGTEWGHAVSEADNLVDYYSGKTEVYPA